MRPTWCGKVGSGLWLDVGPGVLAQPVLVAVMAVLASRLVGRSTLAGREVAAVAGLVLLEIVAHESAHAVSLYAATRKRVYVTLDVVLAAEPMPQRVRLADGLEGCGGSRSGCLCGARSRVLLAGGPAGLALAQRAVGIRRSGRGLVGGVVGRVTGRRPSSALTASAFVALTAAGRAGGRVRFAARTAAPAAAVRIPTT